MFSLQQTLHLQSGTALMEATRKNPEFLVPNETSVTEKSQYAPTRGPQLLNFEDEPELIQVAPDSMGGLRRSKSVFIISDGPCRTETQEDVGLSPTVQESCFGVDLRRHTGDRIESPSFDKDLRAIMEPHLRQARLRREECRNKALLEIDITISSNAGVPYPSLRTETPFLFDVHSFPMHEILAQTLGVQDLSKIHEHSIQDKRQLLQPLLQPVFRHHFHACYDQFVTAFCIPLLHSLAMKHKIFHTTSPTASTKIVYRYQAFPCIRVVRPGECSIGPHCDAAYGHSIGSLNFHVPLTTTYGTNALYTESHVGKEDWHPLTTKTVGLGYLFDGARCLHFGLENTTPTTRVSLDFRVAMYREDDTDDGLCTREMLEDRYSREGPGYYDEAVIETGPVPCMGHFVAKKANRNILLEPDKRMGFPFA